MKNLFPELRKRRGIDKPCSGCGLPVLHGSLYIDVFYSDSMLQKPYGLFHQECWREHQNSEKTILFSSLDSDKRQSINKYGYFKVMNGSITEIGIKKNIIWVDGITNPLLEAVDELRQWPILWAKAYSFAK